MEKNCLTCKYEPDWGDWTAGEYSRCFGACKWDEGMPKLPAVMTVQMSHVIRYSDDSGVHRRCDTWEKK